MNTCKYTLSTMWIVTRIPLATCEMKWISSIIAKSHKAFLEYVILYEKDCYKFLLLLCLYVEI